MRRRKVSSVAVSSRKFPSYQQLRQEGRRRLTFASSLLVFQQTTEAKRSHGKIRSKIDKLTFFLELLDQLVGSSGLLIGLFVLFASEEITREIYPL
jgi:hypothetical protein